MAPYRSQNPSPSTLRRRAKKEATLKEAAVKAEQSAKKSRWNETYRMKQKLSKGLPPPSPSTFRYSTPSMQTPGFRIIRSSPMGASLASSSSTMTAEQLDFLCRSADRTAIFHDEMGEKAIRGYTEISRQLAGELSKQLADLTEKQADREDMILGLAMSQDVGPPSQGSPPSLINVAEARASPFASLGSGGDVAADAVNETKKPAAKGFSFATSLSSPPGFGMSASPSFASVADEAEDKKPAAKGFGFGGNLSSPPGFGMSASLSFASVAAAANEAEDKKPAAKRFGYGGNLSSPAPTYSATAGFTFVGPPVPAGGFTFTPSTPARPPVAAAPPQGFAAPSDDDDDVSL